MGVLTYFQLFDRTKRHMGKLDKTIGTLLFLIALPLAMYSNAHWSAVLLLVAAAAIFVLFIVPGKRKRCGNCGYYYILTVYESYFDKPKSSRCSACETERVAHAKTPVAGE